MPHTHTLVLYAHPAPRRSAVNRSLAEAGRAAPGVLVHDLYEIYPDFDVDGDRERALLASAQAVVLLHPFRWYGMPALMKEWMEIVLTPGWAYGDGPCALRGKVLWLVTTTGSGPAAYQPGGLHGRPFADFLAPYEQAAALCGMAWRAPLVLHGAAQAGEPEIGAAVDAFRRGLAALIPADTGVVHGA